MEQKIDLESLCQGGFSERINKAMAEIAQNIQDPNTDPVKVRKLTCTITLKADKRRTLVAADIQTKTSLAPALGIETSFVMGTDLVSGKVQVEEYDNQIRGQMSLEDIKEDEADQEIVKTVDPSTGEIYETPVNKVVDLRKAK